ncbi:unnamed protein product [Phytophthora lilii]|uniref:Unnamed protein product n=1 Tax=Phytophthora lilii TaxID=2077276 RepID=A0A9W6X2F4_9STRA|nr:unnamed protein product [Phytophthora lilii]
MKTFATPSGIIVLAALIGSADAHGYCSKPKATFKPGDVYTNFVGTATASINKGFDGGIYNHAPVDNAKQFTQHWAATGYSSLREMMDSVVPGCGNTDENAAPVDVSGYTEMSWQNNEYKEGFLESHHGPCEAWIDNTKVFHYDDCRESFPGFPANIPTDYSSCNGKCTFIFYWIALHSPTWQLYKNCIPITNNGSGSKTGASTPAGQTGNEATSPAATDAPESNTASETTPSTPEPAESTTKTGDATAVGSQKCNGRLRS